MSMLRIAPNSLHRSPFQLGMRGLGAPGFSIAFSRAGGTLYAGDSYQVSISGATPSADVIVYWSNFNPDGSDSGGGVAAIGTTDASGNWSSTQTIQSTDYGNFQTTWWVGGKGWGSEVGAAQFAVAPLAGQSAPSQASLSLQSTLASNPTLSFQATDSSGNALAPGTSLIAGDQWTASINGATAGGKVALNGQYLSETDAFGNIQLSGVISASQAANSSLQFTVAGQPIGQTIPISTTPGPKYAYDPTPPPATAAMSTAPPASIATPVIATDAQIAGGTMSPSPTDPTVQGVQIGTDPTTGQQALIITDPTTGVTSTVTSAGSSTIPTLPSGYCYNPSGVVSPCSSLSSSTSGMSTGMMLAIAAGIAILIFANR